ncbi:MAG: ArsR family transcriptional regulator [Gemmatimonadota bacterium]
MPTHPLSDRFLEGTQGRAIELLREAPRTVEELATALELTGNAVRLQLATLERDGLVRVEGRRPTGRKPALVYGLTTRADFLLSKSYVPVLQALLDVLGDRLSLAERTTLLREVGRRLVLTAPRATGSRRERLLAAARALEGFGGKVRLEASGRSAVLVASGCPIGEVVRAHPEACRVVETVVEEISGVKVREQCERGDRPRCSFVAE